MKRVLGGAILTLCFATTSLAFTAESLLQWEYVTDPRWSPNSERLAFVKVRTDEEADTYAREIWLWASRDGARALSQPGVTAFMPRWHPSGSWLAFLTREGKRTELRALAATGGESTTLWSSESGIQNFAWSPDGEAILLSIFEEPASSPAFVVTDRLDLRRDGRSGYRDERINRLAILAQPFSTSPKFAILNTGRRSVSAPAWSADSQQIYYVQNTALADDRNTSQTDVFVVDARPDAEPVLIVSGVGPDGTPLPSPDGEWLATVGFAATDPPASYTPTDITLTRIRYEESATPATTDQASNDQVPAERSPELADETESLASDGSLVHNLTAQYRYGVANGMAGDVNAPGGGGGRIQWSADSQFLYFTSAIRGRVQLVSANVETGEVIPLTRVEQGEIGVFDVAPNGRVAAVFSRPDLAPNLVAFEASTAARGAWQQLTNLNADLLSDYRLASYREVTASPEEGVDIQGWLIAPTKFDRRRRYPLILYIHGGPHAMYGTNFFHEFQYLANAGYYVLIGNPRGSTGYGGEFGNVIQYRYPGVDYDDLMALVDAVSDERTIDTERLGVAGGSGGGLLTTWIVGRTDRFKAASAHRSVTNWLSFVGTADYNGYFVDHWFDQLPWTDPTSYLARSPITLVDKVNTPVQIVHSDADYRTPLEQSLQYYTALRVLGKPAELVVFRDESHGLSRGGRPSNRVERIRRIRAWFDKYLR